MALALLLGGLSSCTKGSADEKSVFVPADRAAVQRETALLFVASRDANTDANTDANAPANGAPPPKDFALPPGHPAPHLALHASHLLPLGEALAALAKAAPEGFPGWNSIALDGAEAARRGDMEGTRAACVACHERHAEAWKGAKQAVPRRPDAR